MDALRNNVRLIGRLGKDVEIIELENGKRYARVSIATTDSYTNKKGVKINETQWHNLKAWDFRADSMKGLRKGMLVAIQGKLSRRSFTDTEGNKRYYTEIIVQNHSTAKAS